MNSEAEIIDAMTTLENELNNIETRVQPVCVPSAPSLATTQPEQARSQVSQRLTNMIRQARDIQARLEI